MVNCHTTYTGRTPRVQRCGAAVLGLFLLVGCNAPLGSAIENGSSYRDQDTLIGVTSRFEEAKFSGVWYLRSYLPEDEGFHELIVRDGKFFVIDAPCPPAVICEIIARDLKAKEVGNGRYIVKTKQGQDRTLWVLWVDEGFRTAVVGNPEGTFAWIIDRSKTGGADRIKAAREILDFNGYDVSQLKVKK